jgi:2-polyprenyl-3-methyl-5-hydroxy-6-metoxy-1,4-benzoquinol methylase
LTVRRVPFDKTWPESWKLSHHYDELELHGAEARSGYVHTYRERRRRTLDLVKRAAPPPAKVLDVAAAQGNFALALAELGYDVTWNDLRADLADYVRLKHDKGTIHYAPGNALELGFSESFDIVLITEIIEHVAHPDQFLAAVARMVKPGGHVVLTTPNGAYFRNTLPRFSDHPDPSVFESAQFQPDSDGHIFLLDEGEIRSLAATAGLDVIEADSFANPLTSGHAKTGAVLRMLPTGLVEWLEGVTQRLPLKSRQNTSLAVLLRKS